MKSTIQRLCAAGALLGVLACAPAIGQQTPASVRFSGVIERVDGDTFFVRTATSQAEVRLMPSTRLLGVGPARLADIRQGLFIGVGASPQPDGSQKAIQVTLFPESLRGLGEGHYPWNRPNTTMTNATVETTVSAVDGQVLTVKYKGGEQKIVIGEGALLRTLSAFERAELRPGVSVAVNGTPKSDTQVDAISITAGRDGMKP